MCYGVPHYRLTWVDFDIPMTLNGNKQVLKMDGRTLSLPDISMASITGSLWFILTLYHGEQWIIKAIFAPNYLKFFKFVLQIPVKLKNKNMLIHLLSSHRALHLGYLIFPF